MVGHPNRNEPYGKGDTEKIKIENEIETLKSFSKPLRNAGYDEISKKVNEEIAALGDDGTFSDFKLIDKKLGLPRGTSFEMGGYSDYFAFEEN
jgi:hypothetical protein